MVIGQKPHIYTKRVRKKTIFLEPLSIYIWTKHCTLRNIYVYMVMATMCITFGNIFGWIKYSHTKANMHRNLGRYHICVFRLNITKQSQIFFLNMFDKNKKATFFFFWFRKQLQDPMTSPPMNSCPIIALPISHITTFRWVTNPDVKQPTCQQSIDINIWIMN